MLLSTPVAWAMPRRTFGRDSNAQPAASQPSGMNPSNGGAMSGNEQGHVTGPGTTPVDTSTRGPLNQSNPGAPPSSDVPASAHPAPAR
jgi:hypothetical protein